jgi:hypothetical protein
VSFSANAGAATARAIAAQIALVFDLTWLMRDPRV